MKHNLLLGTGAAILGIVALSADAKTYCSGESAQVRADLATGTRIAASTETLTYSAKWCGGNSVKLAANGTTLEGAEELGGSGTYVWTPSGGGAVELTHTVVTSGVPVVLTAKFVVPVSVGDGTYALIEDGVCTIAGTGDMRPAEPGKSALWDYQSQFSRVVIGDEVTGVGANVFAYMKGVKDVEIGDSVTNIAEKAFYHCTYVTNLVVGAGVETVGDNAFERNYSLTTASFGAKAAADACQDAFKITARITMAGDTPIVDAVPEVTIDGWDRQLEGKTNLTDSAWLPLDAMKPIPYGFHFFRYEFVPQE